MPWALVNWTNGDRRRLKGHGAYVAQACDGTTDLTSLALLSVHHAFLDWLIDSGIVRECGRGEPIDPRQAYRKAENPHLKTVHLSVTGRCNLDCRHCGLDVRSGRYDEMSFEDLMHVIGQLERANVHEVSLTGGEPFLRGDLPEIIEALAARRIRVSRICTNGLLITKEVLDGVRRIGCSSVLQISFDGVGTHEYMRGRKGSERSVIEGIRKVRAAGLPVVIATAVDRVTMGSLGETYELLKGLDIQTWRIAPSIETGNWRGTTTAAAVEEQAEAYESVLRRWLGDDRPFAIELSAFFQGAGRGERGTEEEVEIRYAREGPDCVPCRSALYVLPDGVLLPCPLLADTDVHDRMPNILRDDLPKVWSGSHLRTVADAKKSDRLARNEECASCNLFERCGMGCRALAALETGDLMAKDPFTCEMWKRGHRQRFLDLAAAAGVDGLQP